MTKDNTKKHGKRVYHKSNCDNKLRAVIKTRYGDTISLFGTHAFNWSIIKEVNGKIIITSFDSRNKAIKELKDKYL